MLRVVSISVDSGYSFKPEMTTFDPCVATTTADITADITTAHGGAHLAGVKMEPQQKQKQEQERRKALMQRATGSMIDSDRW